MEVQEPSAFAVGVGGLDTVTIDSAVPVDPLDGGVEGKGDGGPHVSFEVYAVVFALAPSTLRHFGDLNVLGQRGSLEGWFHEGAVVVIKAADAVRAYVAVGGELDLESAVAQGYQLGPRLVGEDELVIPIDVACDVAFPTEQPGHLGTECSAVSGHRFDERGLDGALDVE